MEQGSPVTQKSDVALKRVIVPEIPMSAFSALEPFTLLFTIKDNCCLAYIFVLLFLF